MSNYTNAAQVASFLQRALNASESSALSSYVLSAVDKIIDRVLQSTFFDTPESTRYFTGGGRAIDIDPVQAITALGSINNDGSLSYSYTNLTEYVAEPINEAVKREIVYRGSRNRFPKGLGRMSVTGKFNEYDYVNSKIPDDIVLVATRLAAGVLNAGKISGKGGNLQREALEGHLVVYDTTSSSLSSLMSDDPIIQSVIGGRRELYLFDDDSETQNDGIIL